MAGARRYMPAMQHRDRSRRSSARSLSQERKREDGAAQMVQQCTGEGGELEQKGREDGSLDIPEEHGGVLGAGSPERDPSYTRRTKEAQAFAKQTLDHYEEECRRIWQESERWRKDEEG